VAALTLLTPGRVRAARILAVAADLAQIVALPALFPTALTPLNNVLDLAVAVALVWLLGWHWAFLPAFLAEMIPLVELVPTWTAAVFIATGGRGLPPGGTPPSGPQPPAPPSGS
jgi:hypothetical protein